MVAGFLNQENYNLNISSVTIDEQMSHVHALW